jgi:hypothetical protein
MNQPAALLLSLLMLAAFALGAGGAYLVLGRGERRKGALMIVAALVALANVLIWVA